VPDSWPDEGLLLGDGWSLAYRTLDAQWWVPQRRKRIYAVADFRSERAADILFERQGAVSFEPGAVARLRSPHYYDNITNTLRADMGDNQSAVAYSIGVHGSEGMKSPNPRAGIYEADTARALDANGGNPACNQGGVAVVEPKTLKIRSGCDGGGKGPLVQNNISATLSTHNDQTLFVPVAFAQNQRGELRDLHDCAGALPELDTQPNVIKDLLESMHRHGNITILEELGDRAGDLTYHGESLVTDALTNSEINDLINQALAAIG